MEPIYDHSGHTVGWLRNGVLFDRLGLAAACVSAGAVFSLQGCYLGRLEDRLLRDKRGCIVAFLRGAGKGAVLPVPKSCHASPVIPDAPEPSLSHLTLDAPLPAAPLLNWSFLSWEQFLAGETSEWP